MAGYTLQNLKEVEDQAPKFGYAPAQQQPRRGGEPSVSVELHPSLPGVRVGQYPRSSRWARMNNVLATLS